MSQPAGPAPDKCCAAGRLSSPARQVHLAVLAAFIAVGQPPPPAELERLAHVCGGDPGAVRAELAAADVFAFTADGRIRAAYPFSSAPTPIRVTWADGPQVHAMCAIDALGMSAMLDRSVTITAAEPGTGRTITVTVDRDRAQWKPRTAVVFAGATGDPCSPAADRSCGNINFFTTARAARAWARRHPEVTGTLLRPILGPGVCRTGHAAVAVWRAAFGPAVPTWCAVGERDSVPGCDRHTVAT